LIPQSFIEELKLRCPIEDVISSYVTLKRAGSNHNGLCPFHSEKTPSFTVFSGTSSFYCFGCGAGGDVISFIMRAENLDYRDALEFLAKRAGISLPDDGTRQERGVTRKRLYEMNTAAAKFFRSALFESDEGGIARNYLNGRGLSQTIIKRFGLGYADGSFNSLRDHLRKQGFTDEEMVAGFLCKKSEKNGSLYDIFRAKVMFPIIDTAGNIVAFGGRVLDNSKPKYINSSDTPAFNKKRNLFALNYAKNSCAERLILCEGYMDVIALHEFGFENAVATLGTAITSEQARLIAKYTKQVIITYDSDEAGQRAADKAFKLLDEVGVDTKILKVEGAKDPDEYLRKFGKVEFEKLLGLSRTRFEFTADKILSEHDITNDEEKVKAIKRLVSYIAAIPSSIEREIYSAKLAEMMDLNVENVQRDISYAIKRRNTEKKKNEHDRLIRDTIGLSDRVNPDFAKNPVSAKLEEAVLGMVLSKQEYLSTTVDGTALCPEDFLTEFGKALFSFIKSANDDGGFEFGQLSEKFNQDEVSRAMKLMLAREKLTDNSPSVFAENVRRMRDSSDIGGADVSDIAKLLSKKRKST